MQRMYLRHGLYLLLLELGDLIAGYDSVMTGHTVKICISLSALLHKHDNSQVGPQVGHYHISLFSSTLH